MKIFYILLFLFFINEIYAQRYIPLIDTSLIWVNSISEETTEMSGTTYLKGDTLIKNIILKKVFSNINTEPPGYQYVGAIYEDPINKKVYVCFNWDTIPRLYYDFSMKINDEITIYTLDQKNLLLKVKDIKFQKDNLGKCRKVFYLKDTLPQTCMTDWIEGIGSLQGLVFCCYYPSIPEWSTFHDYLIRGSDTLFDYLTGDTCMTSSIKKQHFLKKNDFLFFPNPMSEISYFYSSEKTIYETITLIEMLSIFDLTGKPIKVSYSIDKDRITLYRGNLDPGFYFYKIKTYSGDSFFGKIIIF